MPSHLNVYALPKYVTPQDIAGGTAVVIDVLRATTTIVYALEAGAKEVLPCREIEEARALAKKFPREEILLGGERMGKPIADFDLGNSPEEYLSYDVEDKTIIFTTTNGTRALLATGPASRVAVGGFVNAGAISRWVGAAPGRAWLVCAGEGGRFCLEDAACAGYLVDRVLGRHPDALLSDSARAALRLARSYRGDWTAMLAEASWAQGLVRAGRGSDLPLCVAIDTHDLVPVLRGGRLVADASLSIDRASGPPP
jgi:2-phosphosulfolactate phosphatase